MKRIFFFTICFVLSIFIDAQNLIPNGSFEQFYHCPTTTGQLDSCIGWHNVKNTPDYFNACADSITAVSIPSNVCGTQYPFEGNGYIGLYTYLYWTFYREIIGTMLTYTMEIGNNYHISMRVSRGNWTNQADNQTATNKLGLRFTTFPYSLVNSPQINNYAQIYVDSVITDTMNWVLLSWDYVPDSAYTHVYLGNFFDDAHTDTINIGWTFGQSYYYVDSVNIICNDANCATVVPIIKMEKVTLNYDQKNSTVNIELFEDNFGALTIFNSIGQKIEQIEIYNDKKINLSYLTEGLYIIYYQSSKTALTKKIIIQK